MPIRNPFARRHVAGPAIVVQDGGNASRPGSAAGDGTTAPVYQPAGFERVDTVGSKASSSAFSVRSRRSQDTGEYKMSVVNDSGIYLPPSPVEKEAVWPRRYLSRSSSGKSSVVPGAGGTDEIEHFSISRESFDSYRRSFDICAKSPVVIADSAAPRQSLDSSLMHHRGFSASSSRYYHPRSGLSFEQRREWQTPEEEGGFEDVGLNDEGKQQQLQKEEESQQRQQQQQQQGSAPAPKKKSFFSKFGVGLDHNAEHDVETTPAAAPTSSWNFLPGRKRAQSGSEGRELGALPNVVIDKSATASTTTSTAVEVES